MCEGAPIAVSDCVRDANVECISSQLWCCTAHRELTAEIAPAVACKPGRGATPLGKQTVRFSQRACHYHRLDSIETSLHAVLRDAGVCTSLW